MEINDLPEESIRICCIYIALIDSLEVYPILGKSRDFMNVLNGYSALLLDSGIGPYTVAKISEKMGELGIKTIK